VAITVMQGDLTRIKAPVAVTTRYEGMPLRGPAARFDRLLDCWLSRAVELGMIGSGLGEVFHTPLAVRQKEEVPAPGSLMVAGMGEPGR
jgi:hypothetical protein